MRVQELPAKEFLAHLGRHPIPEIMDDECMAALKSIEREYGDTITHGAGLEVRLGEEARYVDYIMNIDEDNIPGVENLWYEIDYDEFRKANATGKTISPCLFMNTDANKSKDAAYWDALLPPFMGEARAKNLRSALFHVINELPKGAYIKQIGTMTGRGELSIMRLVIMFHDWDSIPEGLAGIGWQGDTARLFNALEPWRQANNVAVNIDLGESGVLPKIGIEAFSRWRHPLIVDKAIARLEDAGLCLPSKADALRRWIRIRPDGYPFIQTLIAYFKLNYRDGKIIEAKAYLEQSPYIHHHYFDAYDRPVYVELMVKDESHALPIGAATQWIKECKKNRVHEVRFTGDVANCEHLDQLLAECKRQSGSEAWELRAVVELAKAAPEAWIEKMIAAGTDDFIININDEGAYEPAAWMLKILRSKGFRNARARWLMHRGNAERLPQVIRIAEKLCAKELIVTGMKPAKGKETPSRDQMIYAAKTIKNWQDEHKKSDDSEGNSDATTASDERMELTVESCFSPLRALMEGDDPKRNGNRGIERGCTAGRNHFCVLPTGKITPCKFLAKAEEYDSLAACWTESPALQAMREHGEPPKSCASCAYERRCLPCPATETSADACPLKQSPDD
ncbi:MAG: hypothetical protein IJT82_08955 [Schwartzia sp.]|nr:hypothetical protein [Schwartzia sp. (in: firmicutes)]